MQNKFLLTQIHNRIQSKIIGNILFYGMGILFLSLTAQLSIPLLPVPVTFESSSVILLGFILGARRASYLVSVYLLLGFIGLPLFAGFTGGLGLLLTPKAGYFIGFIPAAFMAGLCKDANILKSFWQRLSIAFIATFIIFAMGVAWFSAIANFKMAWALGVMPFVFTEMLKVLGVSVASGFCLGKSSRD